MEANIRVISVQPSGSERKRLGPRIDKEDEKGAVKVLKEHLRKFVKPGLVRIYNVKECQRLYLMRFSPPGNVCKSKRIEPYSHTPPEGPLPFWQASNGILLEPQEGGLPEA